MERLTLTLNGQHREVGQVHAHTTLLEWLRLEGLTGSKEGCAEGECGACAVLLVRADARGQAQYVATNSCLLLVGALNGQEVVTVEGLGTPGRLHPVQKSLAERGGSQCGYCTPGFVMSMAAEYYRDERSAFDLEALSGNLCRCTGYRPIRDAARALGQPDEHDQWSLRLAQGAPLTCPTVLTSEHGELRRCETLPQTLAVLAENPSAKLLAGGTDWSVDVNLRHARAPLTLAIDHHEELRAVHWTPEYVEIGAALTLSEIESQLNGRLPLLHDWTPQFASRLIRNRATLGGNLGTASPIGDSAPVLLALNASVVLQSAARERTVALKDFFVRYRETVLQHGELIRAVRVPLPHPMHARFYKVTKRRLDDISSVAAAFALDLDGGAVRRIRIGLGGVAATPLRAAATEAFLNGQPWNEQTVRDAARLMSCEGTPLGDLRASEAYRKAMLEQLLLKFYEQTTDQRVEVEG
ncbi:xanthine dehydrogenase small subunit [Deinococcus peraridilitoris]|uniref:Xanthine dehydrogenase, iron-sulfur cluster and FAD-binding subunit A n=1 Tax=Deinococcus peraridilitoris (strain DSM 19664 / LMG 22246 / CIP 109416 / KR-200) TaxID=937777 RepID=K9ZVP6_DEIPD|nr:FAD binding domain-containing protein [Deinococcus peraridilitoris]AFZ65688.1 xanthine dehydrogenase, iron-sulfur cluster and FAD-binding subunit A [Deinococcus peraridilitoris DSM 19664]